MALSEERLVVGTVSYFVSYFVRACVCMHSCIFALYLFHHFLDSRKESYGFIIVRACMRHRVFSELAG